MRNTELSRSLIIHFMIETPQILNYADFLICILLITLFMWRITYVRHCLEKVTKYLVLIINVCS